MRLVSVPLQMLKTSSVRSGEAASGLRPAMSSVKTKSIVWQLCRTPRMSGGSPASTPLHPPDEHLGVEAVHVHPRAVHVEVTQGHVVEATHCVEAAEPASLKVLAAP